MHLGEPKRLLELKDHLFYDYTPLQCTTPSYGGHRGDLFS